MLKDELKPENMNLDQVNCAVDCTQGCILSDRCPHKQYQKEATSFIHNTSLDKMLEIAEIARIKKISAPPTWVIPDEI